jgi:hypothetical protein
MFIAAILEAFRGKAALDDAARVVYGRSPRNASQTENTLKTSCFGGSKENGKINWNNTRTTNLFPGIF